MKTSSIFKKGAIALSLAAGLSIAGGAAASSLGQSTLQITNFKFLTSVGGPELSASAFSSLAIHDSTNLSPFLNGVGNQHVDSTNGGLPLPLFVACVGTCPGGSPFANAPIPPATSAALGASSLDGVPIQGLPGFPPGPTSGANARTAALSQLTSNGLANSSANLILDTQFTFALNQSQSVTVDFDSLVHLIAFLSNTNGSAHAGVGWNIDISILNGASVFNWAPNGVLNPLTGATGGTEVADNCNLNASRTVLLAGQAGLDCTGHETATTGLLLAGVQYQLSISHQTLSDVTLVPEPETVLLMGLGLVGLGLTQRRRKAKKA